MYNTCGEGMVLKIFKLLATHLSLFVFFFCNTLKAAQMDKGIVPSAAVQGVCENGTMKGDTAVILFNMPHLETLEQLITLAIQTHPSLKMYFAQKKSAEEKVKYARWQFYPTPSLSTERVFASDDDPFNQGDDYVFTLRLQQPLWTGNRLTAELHKARANALCSELAIEENFENLALHVVQKYGNCLAAWLKRKAWKKSLDIHQQLKDKLHRRVELGVTAESDLVLAEGRFEFTRAEYLSACAQEEMLLSSLSYLVGRKLQASLLTHESSKIPSVPLDDLSVFIKKALKRNPAVKKALARVKLAKAEIDKVKSAFWPEIYLRVERQCGNYFYRNSSPEDRIFIGFTSRFGAGFSSFSALNEAQAKYEAALKDVEVKRMIVREQVKADYIMVGSFKKRFSALESSLRKAQNVFHSYTRQFLAGKKSWQTVMNAARDVAQAEVQIADALATQLIVTCRLAIMTEGLSIFKTKK